MSKDEDEPELTLARIAGDVYCSNLYQSVRNQLQGKRVILASGSKQRLAILRQTGIDVDVVVPLNYDEFDPPRIYPKASALTIDLAYRKAMKVAESHAAELIIGAYTMIMLGTEIIGKPWSEKNARKILRKLQGKTHKVYTGVTLIWAGFPPVKYYSRAQVTMKTISKEIVRAYVSEGESMDKVGAYAIQGFGASLVEKLDGTTDTVGGFPLWDFFNAAYNHYKVFKRSPSPATSIPEKPDLSPVDSTEESQ